MAMTATVVVAVVMIAAVMIAAAVISVVVVAVVVAGTAEQRHGDGNNGKVFHMPIIYHNKY